MWSEPVIDVSTVTIFPTNLPCAVYGDISARDKLDLTSPKYVLYQRDAEHAELISEPGQALSVIGLDNVLRLQQPVISLSLKVKDSRAADEGDAFIARGTVELDLTTNNDYEEVKQLDVKGDCGHATVNYIALSCALVAHTMISLSDGYWDAVTIDGNQDSDVKSSVYGSIVAQYDKTFGDTNHFRIPLLNVPADQSIPLYFDGHDPKPTIKLTRNHIAVPAYAFLNIKANLRSTLTGTSVVNEEDIVILWPPHTGIRSMLKHNAIPKRCLNVFQTTTNWYSLSNLQPSCRHTKSNWDYGEKLLEVFSIFIGRKNDDILNVSGTITIEDHSAVSKVVIFKRDDRNPDRLLDGRKLLAITCPSITRINSTFIILSIRVSLEDANRGFFIEDIVSFDTTYNDSIESRFNTFLCSVLPGHNGYCAVHYTLFNSAARVSLKIVLLCKGVDVARVYGKIVAWSDMLDYSTDYNQKYYRRTLYDMPEIESQVYYPRKAAPKKTIQNSFDEHMYGEVELSEPCVAVPVDFRYNIGVDLYASSNTRSGLPEHLHKTVQFQYDNNKQMEKILIEGGVFDLCIQPV